MTAAERERDLPHLTRDGSCQIVQIVRTGVSQPIAHVWTDLYEKFAVFAENVLAILSAANISGRRVYLNLKRTPHGRYIANAQLLPCGDEESYPCVRCGATATRLEHGGGFSCPSCHHIMFVSSGN